MADNQYARLDDNQPSYNNENPYPNLNNQSQPNPVVVQDPINYGQPYNPPNQGFNQGFNPNQGPIIYNNQGFNPNPDNNALLSQFASSTRTLCLTAIIQDIIYIIFDIIYYGFTLNLVFIVMIIQIIRFGILLSGVQNNQASFAHFLQTKKTFLCMFIFYIVVFTLDLILLIVVLDTAKDSDIDVSTFITVFVVSAVLFLLPRIIAMFVVRNVGKGVLLPAAVVVA